MRKFLHAFLLILLTPICWLSFRLSVGCLQSPSNSFALLIASPHSTHWKLAGKNHATAFVCDCRCADRSSWQYFNIVRSYSVAEHSASLLSVVRVSWIYCWTKSRLSFSRAWGESAVVFGGLFIFKVSTVSAAPHSVPWNLAGKNHATAFVCDCRCADRSSWQYFNIVRSYSVAEHSASLLSVVRVSWIYCWTKSRLSFSRAWGESVVLLRTSTCFVRMHMIWKTAEKLA